MLSHQGTPGGRIQMEASLDDKGRICIPKEIRDKLELKTGERLLFQLANGNIILRKTVSTEEFIKSAGILREKIKGSKSAPIPFEKLF
jgi:AbrB family looped-hinge helix DNA binding protein